MPRIRPEIRQRYRLKQYEKSDFSNELRVAAHWFEEKYLLEGGFDSITHFSGSDLASLHAPDAGLDQRLFGPGFVASPAFERIRSAASVLAEVANGEVPTIDDRRRYQSALVEIYGHLDLSLEADLTDPDVLFVGVEREGRQLAQLLHWLPDGHFVTPHAKRMPFGDDGLLVGIKGLRLDRTFRKAVIIDGAIASGATVIAIADLIRRQTGCSAIQVASAHATTQGLRAAIRYSDATGIDLQIAVGFSTDGLSDTFYAMQGDREVVGDLGNTICEGI